MKNFIALLSVAMVFTGCVKQIPVNTPDQDATEVTDLTISSTFDWKTTSIVDCDFVASYPSKVFVSLEAGDEPFATFMAGGTSDPVMLSVPVTAQTFYVSYQTESGVSQAEAVAVVNGKAAFTVPKGAKEYDGGNSSTEGDVIYMPARKNGWGTLLFEDMWPAYGDYDFNDLVANYKVQLYMNNKNKVDAMLVALRVKAIGGSLPYDLGLSMLGVKGGEIDLIEPYEGGFSNAPTDAKLEALNNANNVKAPAILRFSNITTGAHRPSGATYLNTERGYEMNDDQLITVAYMVYFRNSIALEDVAFDTFDFFIVNSDRKEIHLGGYAPTLLGADKYDELTRDNVNIADPARYYLSKSNLVWALNVPASINHAYERESFLKAYPYFAAWAESGGVLHQDWYLKGNSANTVHK